MARKASAGGREPKVVLVIDRSEAERKLGEQTDKGVELRRREIRTAEDLKLARRDMYTWCDYCEALLESMFSTDKLKREFEKTWGFAGGTLPFSAEVQEYERDLERYLRILGSIRDRLELYDERPGGGSVVAASGRKSDAVDKVFLVHGTNEGIKQGVARFIEHLGLHVTILHEQPNLGRTLIEKFEQEGETGFAVIVLTGDDVGAPAGKPDELKRRARQNVILECGYFIGKVGRNRVAVVNEEGLELPSDLLGIAYVPIDNQGGWKLILAREMRAAGLEVDLNKAM
jgi:hypothetical protein